MTSCRIFIVDHILLNLKKAKKNQTSCGFEPRYLWVSIRDGIHSSTRYTNLHIITCTSGYNDQDCMNNTELLYMFWPCCCLSQNLKKNGNGLIKAMLCYASFDRKMLASYRRLHESKTTSQDIRKSKTHRCRWSKQDIYSYYEMIYYIWFIL